jgi:hypothetical protein
MIIYKNERLVALLQVHKYIKDKAKPLLEGVIERNDR